MKEETDWKVNFNKIYRKGFFSNADIERIRLELEIFIGTMLSSERKRIAGIAEGIVKKKINIHSRFREEAVAIKAKEWHGDIIMQMEDVLADLIGEITKDKQ